MVWLPKLDSKQVTGWLTAGPVLIVWDAGTPRYLRSRIHRQESHHPWCPIGVRYRSGLFVITVEQESAECPISVHRSRNRRGLWVRQTRKSPEYRQAFRALVLGKLMLYQLSYSRSTTSNGRLRIDIFEDGRQPQNFNTGYARPNYEPSPHVEPLRRA